MHSYYYNQTVHILLTTYLILIVFFLSNWLRLDIAIKYELQ